MLTRLTMVAILVLAASACRTEKPDRAPTFTCSAAAPDICWREATNAFSRRPDEAAAKFEVACGVEGYEKRGMACTWAALGVVDEEPDRATPMLETACELRISTACARLGQLFLQRAFSGDPSSADTRTNRTRAVQLFDPVCELDDVGAEADVFGDDPRAVACSGLGQLHHFGVGAPPAPQKALIPYERACGFGIAYSCANAAELHLQLGSEGAVDKAAELYARGCEGALYRSCTQAALMKAVQQPGDDQIARLLAVLDSRAAEMTASVADGEVSDKAWVTNRMKVMQDVDQLYRKASMLRGYLAEDKRDEFGEELSAKTKAVDHENRAGLKGILDHWGWLTISEFGRQVSNQAWLIVQHADDDLAFQKEVLARFESLLENEEVEPSSFAYLYDRVAVNEGRKQRFGTQGGCVDGEWQPKPMEDPNAVDSRRSSVGLEPLDSYQKMFEGQCR